MRSLHRTILDGRTLNVRFYKPSKANSVNGGNPDPPPAHFTLPYGAAGNGAPLGGLGPGVMPVLHPPPPQAMHDMMLPQGNGMMGGYGDMYHHTPHAPPMHYARRN